MPERNPNPAARPRNERGGRRKNLLHIRTLRNYIRIMIPNHDNRLDAKLSETGDSVELEIRALPDCQCFAETENYSVSIGEKNARIKFDGNHLVLPSSGEIKLPRKVMIEPNWFEKLKKASPEVIQHVNDAINALNESQILAH